MVAIHYVSDFDGPTRELLATKQYYIGPEGKIHWKIDHSGIDYGYIHYNAGSQVYCHYWNDVYCKHYKIIPSYCRVACWKTVVKLPDVESVFQFEKIMKRLDLPSKIGVDAREYTFGLWVAFFYDMTLDDGHETYDLIMRQIEKHMPKEKAKDISVLLKRGCTEMEALEPADRWNTIGASHYEKEKMLDKMFYFSEQAAHYQQSKWYKEKVRQGWARTAVQIGDKTLFNIIDQEAFKRLVVPTVSYHNKRPQNPEEIHVEAEDVKQKPLWMNIEEGPLY